MSITIKDVARMANVSVATASLALNDRNGVNNDTRMRVKEVAERYNYTPNQSARNLITKKSGTIGLVVTDITNPFFGMLVDEVNKSVLGRGYDFLLGVSNNDIRNEAKCIDTLLRQRTEGVIVVPSAQPNANIEHIYKLKQSNVPFVFATTSYLGIEADCVMTDLKKGSYMLTRHLLETGHRKIFLIASDRFIPLSVQRIDGYKDAFEEMGLKYSEDWIIQIKKELNYDSSYEATKSLIEQSPDAIMTINDVMALGVIRCLKDNGIRVPEDISVAGYDDLLYTSILETPLTTVRQPIAHLADKCVQILIERIEKSDNPPCTYFVQPTLKIRATTKH